MIHRVPATRTTAACPQGRNRRSRPSGINDAATRQQPMPLVFRPGSIGSQPQRGAAPCCAPQAQKRSRVSGGRSRAATCAEPPSVCPQGLVVLHRQHVGQALILQPPPSFRYCRTPSPATQPHPSRPPGRSSVGPVVLCMKDHSFWNSGFPPSLPVRCPLLGQIQLPIRGGCHRPGTLRSGSPPSPPCRCTAASPPLTSWLEKRLIHYQHPSGPELNHIPLPSRTSSASHWYTASAHPIGSGVPSVLGQLPPVLALHRPQQSLQVRQHALRLTAAEAMGDTPVQGLEPRHFLQGVSSLQ